MLLINAAASLTFVSCACPVARYSWHAVCQAATAALPVYPRMSPVSPSSRPNQQPCRVPTPCLLHSTCHICSAAWLLCLCLTPVVRVCVTLCSDSHLSTFLWLDRCTQQIAAGRTRGSGDAKRRAHEGKRGDGVAGGRIGRSDQTTTAGAAACRSIQCVSSTREIRSRLSEIYGEARSEKGNATGSVDERWRPWW